MPERIEIYGQSQQGASEDNYIGENPCWDNTEERPILNHL